MEGWLGERRRSGLSRGDKQAIYAIAVVSKLVNERVEKLISRMAPNVIGCCHMVRVGC